MVADDLQGSLTVFKRVKIVSRPNVLYIAKEKNQRGITLLETMLAMVIAASIILPAFGFLTLAMEEQVNARTLTAETSNIAAVDLDLVRAAFPDHRAFHGPVGRLDGRQWQPAAHRRPTRL